MAADATGVEKTLEHGVELPGRKIPSLREVAGEIIRKRKLENTIAYWRNKTFHQLCSTCRSLDLTVEKFIIQDHSSDRSQQAYRSYLPQTNPSEKLDFPLGSGSGKYSLGALKDIWSKSEKCPFCSLVIKSLQIVKIEDTAASDEGRTICYASWQVDGRQPLRDPRGHVISTRARTRRIRLHWDDNTFHESYLVLLAPEAPQRFNSDIQYLGESEALFLGRYINSAGKNQILVKRWLDLCHGSHGKLCETERGREFEEMISKSYFGVIDVHEMRLTSLPRGKGYVALSYMWGVGERYTSTLANIQGHRAYGGIEKAVPKLPRVIRDAIQLVRGLGERYLWVDSLCIVQDSPRSWSLNARVMDLVYGNAHLTICATDGEGAMTGLKGLTTERYVLQHTEECAQGVRLMVSHLAETYIQRSKWNTRGWTFQERLLSKRCLIFAEGRVYFQCRSTAMSEDITAEQKDAGWSIELVHAPLQMLHELESRAFRVYTVCVELYTSRILGRPEDILAAFQGMSNLIGKALGNPLLFGLPSSHFDLALLWEPQDAPKCRKSIDRVDVHGMDFPSWSWCGWMGTAMGYKKSTIEGCLSDAHQWLTEHTWIIWYIRDGHGSLRPVWNGAKCVDNHDINSRWRGYGATVRGDDSHYDSYGRFLRPEFLGLPRSNFYRTLPDYPFCVSMAEPDADYEKQFPDQRFLQFWTWSAFLRLIPHKQSPHSNLGKDLRRYDIADYTGDWCGTIVLDRDWGKDQPPGAEHEFVAISEAKDFTQEENDSWTYYIPKEKEQSEWDLYYVLLVEHHRGIARRVGLGKVFKEAFFNPCLPGRQWKEFILE
ncbi:MAG: hypothetical protein M1813_001609 [Trichoglossum hirsutum]|nr:MAG: hypothetical protein M1813_001609 [Trichoglossum hirsutum]